MIDKDTQELLQIGANLVVVGEALIKIGKEIEKRLNKNDKKADEKKK